MMGEYKLEDREGCGREEERERERTGEKPTEEKWLWRTATVHTLSIGNEHFCFSILWLRRALKFCLTVHSIWSHHRQHTTE